MFLINSGKCKKYEEVGILGLFERIERSFEKKGIYWKGIGERGIYTNGAGFYKQMLFWKLLILVKE